MRWLWDGDGCGVGVKGLRDGGGVGDGCGVEMAPGWVWGAHHVQSINPPLCTDSPLHCCMCWQLSQSKAAEVEGLLQRLSDSNDEMGALMGGAGDARAHLLARHRDILQDYTQVRRAQGGGGGGSHAWVRLWSAWLGDVSVSPGLLC